ncbi:MAG: transposase, partial [Cyanothece sp. SIO1E1]|nr:transposase [Cyanothece sp. SIO1E1]
MLSPTHLTKERVFLLTMPMTHALANYDSPWKEALERYFEAFMAFFFPQAHTDIDWARGYEFLDKELQQVARDAELGQRLVDKLVKLWRKDGQEAWVLVHIEIQNQVDPDFAKRMYVYNYRLFDRYDRQVVSLAILGDEQSNWRPQQYGYALWGCQVNLEFPVVKLLDYEPQWEHLNQSTNPFAV